MNPSLLTEIEKVKSKFNRSKFVIPKDIVDNFAITVVKQSQVEGATCVSYTIHPSKYPITMNKDTLDELVKTAFNTKKHPFSYRVNEFYAFEITCDIEPFIKFISNLPTNPAEQEKKKKATATKDDTMIGTPSPKVSRPILSNEFKVNWKELIIQFDEECISVDTTCGLRIERAELYLLWCCWLHTAAKRGLCGYTGGSFPAVETFYSIFEERFPVYVTQSLTHASRLQYQDIYIVIPMMPKLPMFPAGAKSKIKSREKLSSQQKTSLVEVFRID